MKPPALSLKDVCYIGLGGMIGSLLRSWLGEGYTGLFPVPTILINVLGASALAMLHASQHRIHAHGRYLYMVGFCGSFTTVSLFSHETLALVQSGHAGLAILNIIVPVLVAFLAVTWIVQKFDRPQIREGDGE